MKATYSIFLKTKTESNARNEITGNEITESKLCAFN